MGNYGENIFLKLLVIWREKNAMEYNFLLFSLLNIVYILTIY